MQTPCTFKVYLSRGADPETKGKVEAVVKYLKYNFAKNRTYVGIRKEKPRYGTDQMRAILTTLKTYEGMDAIGKALEYCIKQELYSARDFLMAVEYFAQTDRPEPEKNAKATVPEKYRSLRPQVRSMEEYLQATEG